MKKASGVDLGTSPHGLSAVSRERTSKQADGSGTAPSAKPVLNFEAAPAASIVDDAASAAQQPPAVASPGEFHGMRFVRYVPVAYAARDWKVSARRIRALLAESRLEGIRRANGYWEVAYPYRFTFGQRGPALKRSHKPEWRAA
jgi:hypothetical protein